jgi:hypothetical protein
MCGPNMQLRQQPSNFFTLNLPFDTPTCLGWKYDSLFDSVECRIGFRPGCKARIPGTLTSNVHPKPPTSHRESP